MKLNKYDIIYYARIMPTIGIYDLIELKIRTVEEDWFTATEERTQHAFIFKVSDFGNKVFINRNEALAKVKEAEKYKKKISDERYYEEY